MKPNHPRRVPEYLQHILDAIDRAKRISYIAAWIGSVDFR